jgi:hypothetical protein
MKYSIPMIGACLCLSSAHAADLSIAFDHASEKNLTRRLDAKPGDRIKATITNTCATHFLYAAVAMKNAPVAANAAAGAHTNEHGLMAMRCGETAARKLLATEGYCELASQDLDFVHAGDNTGYVIDIRRQPGAPAASLGLSKEDFAAAVTTIAAGEGCAVPGDVKSLAKKLEERTYYVSVRDTPWALGMSGGVSISKVVDPRYAIVADPGSTANPADTIVIRDAGAEDQRKIGFAGYLHVHHERMQWHGIPFALTFGLGIDEQNTMSTLLGFSAAAADLAYITLGWNWAAIDRLPAGQQLNKKPINDNVLNNLPKRTDSGLFLGVSFKFMSPGEAFFTGKVVPKIDTEKPKSSAQPPDGN